MSGEQWRMTACDAVAALKDGTVTPLDLIDAALARIEATEPAINALPTLCVERARDAARHLMAEPPNDPPPHFLHGLPIAIKDLVEVAGVRTTMGSPIYADHVPESSNLAVRVLEANGAIVLAKSNTPEFGAGSQTFNEVFGATRNPWNLAKTVGGSSGGAAAALAAGQVWLADGSDFGGSLRNPASYCSVVGLRPSPGRVPRAPTASPFSGLGVNGPMARNVRDLALMLDAQIGQYDEDPLSLARPETAFSAAIDGPATPLKVAVSPGLGVMRIDPQVEAVIRQAADGFAEMGAEVVEDGIDFGDAEACFQILRAQQFAIGHREKLARHRDQLKPEMIWNIEQGLNLTADDLIDAEQARAALYRRTVAFFQDYDLLLCAAASVPPFDVTMRYPEEVAGVRFDNYLSWMRVAFAVTLTACPALSIPAGFTADGLPVGLQIVAAPRAEAKLLAAAARFEALNNFDALLPVGPA